MNTAFSLYVRVLDSTGQLLIYSKIVPICGALFFVAETGNQPGSLGVHRDG